MAVAGIGGANHFAPPMPRLPSGPPPQPSSEQVKFLFLLRALARLSLQIVGTHGSCVRVNSWKSGSTFGRTGRASLHSGGSVSELQLAAPVRMAGALRKAGEAAAKLRRPGAAVSERTSYASPPLRASVAVSTQVKFLFLLRALARLSLHSGGSVSELQLAAPVRMAGRPEKSRRGGRKAAAPRSGSV